MTEVSETALQNLSAAWRALALIREAVEELAPPGSVTAREWLGPDPMQEAEALVRGIKAIARRSSKRLAELRAPGDRWSGGVGGGGGDGAFMIRPTTGPFGAVASCVEIA